MILPVLAPYLVFVCALIVTCAAGWIVVMPWLWRWGILISVCVTIMGLVILALGGATALDVAHYLGWLT